MAFFFSQAGYGRRTEMMGDEKACKADQSTGKKTILLDSSSIILAYGAGVLPGLCCCYRVLLPASVYEEITIAEKFGAKEFRQLQTAGSFQILPSEGEFLAEKEKLHPELLKMGRGERDVLTHILHGRGSFPVVDDRLAAKFCVKHKISFINALLLPKILYWAALISQSECTTCYSFLEKRGHYSKSILNRAENLSAEDLLQFFP